MNLRVWMWVWSAILSAGLWPLTAMGGDGRIEISQSCATGLGCGPGDAPGFPVSLQVTGGYLLTSDLTPGPDLPAIEIKQNSIDLDLNGFSVRGPGILGGPISGIVSFNLFAFNSRIRNGAVRGFRGKGIDLAQIDGIQLEDLLVYDNDGGGVALGDHGLVRNLRVRGNGDFGMSLGNTTAYEDCSVSETDQGPAVMGGVQIAGSYCDDRTCTRYPPLRRYYLTTNAVQGSQAANACAPGFHIASVWELLDLGDLRYDTTLGPGTDQRSGPPSQINGWAYVDADSCLDWTDTSASRLGGLIALRTTVSQDTGPWATEAGQCVATFRVWCLED